MAASILSRAFGLLATGVLSQNIGKNFKEQHPEIDFYECRANGRCRKQKKPLVLDANWRWTHDGTYNNCYKDGQWDPVLCPDPETCTKNCHIDGATTEQYKETYGIDASGNALTLNFVTEHEYGSNFGSRVYLMDNKNKYKMFHMKNKEFTLTVDMARMPCGLNGAVYFVEMEKDGGKASSRGSNKAGAKYGTGYCDAQCPHDLKWIGGEANSKGWKSDVEPPVGHYGACCAEMDLWEANSRATAYTPHPCSMSGYKKCEGTECGDNDSDERYDGVCDKDGCDYNSYRLGEKKFYGRGSDFVLDAKQKMTVVTQFITHDNTDTGDLVDIRRFYVQNGQVVPNSNSSMAGIVGNSVTDSLCSEMKKEFGDINDFKRKGGLKAMGEALDRGMVLVMSLWDDPLANMLWLDSTYPADASASTPGVLRGPCRTDTGEPKYLRSKYPGANVEFSDLKVGPIGSTFGSGQQSGSSGDPYGDDRRLKEDGVFV